MSNNGLPHEFTPFSLEHTPNVKVFGTVKVGSFSDYEKSYIVDTENQTCTCPNFVEDRLPFVGIDHLGRWCKHLADVLGECGALEDLDEWQKAILDQGYGGPLFAFTVELKTAQPMVLTVNSRLEWIDVYARAKRASENMSNATGKIKRYGWEVATHRWSYGEAPAGASELRPLLKSFDKLEMTPNSAEDEEVDLNTAEADQSSSKFNFLSLVLIVLASLAILFALDHLL